MLQWSKYHKEHVALILFEVIEKIHKMRA